MVPIGSRSFFSLQTADEYEQQTGADNGHARDRERFVYRAGDNACRGYGNAHVAPGRAKM